MSIFLEFYMRMMYLKKKEEKISLLSKLLMEVRRNAAV